MAHDSLLTRTHERNCCLFYDYMTDDEAAGDPLKELDLDVIALDLDVIALLGSILISRPLHATMSHKDSLELSVEHAKLYLANSDQPIEPNFNVTYAGLRQKLNKIMASDYFTTTPEIMSPVEVAAAVGNYTCFQEMLHGSMIPHIGFTGLMEGSAAESEQEVIQRGRRKPQNCNGNGMYADETGLAAEVCQGSPEVESLLKLHEQTEQGNSRLSIKTSGRLSLRSNNIRTKTLCKLWKSCGGAHRGYANGHGRRGIEVCCQFDGQPGINYPKEQLQRHSWQKVRMVLKLIWPYWQISGNFVELV